MSNKSIEEQVEEGSKVVIEYLDEVRRLLAGLPGEVEKKRFSDWLTNALQERDRIAREEAYRNVLENVISDDVEELSTEGLRREIIFRVKYELQALTNTKAV